jgi:hypothetical protein
MARAIRPPTIFVDFHKTNTDRGARSYLFVSRSGRVRKCLVGLS